MIEEFNRLCRQEPIIITLENIFCIKYVSRVIIYRTTPYNYLVSFDIFKPTLKIINKYKKKLIDIELMKN